MLPTLHLPVLIEPDEDGGYVASCPAIQGCHTQGETYEETVANIREAIKLCLEVMKERGEELPHAKGYSVMTVAVAV